MALVFNMVGGSGSFNPSNALIHVNAPLGSTISFEKNNVIVAIILPAKSFPNEDGITADYYYSIKSANYGTWTIISTDGTSTASKIITVNDNNQYDVTLIYSLILYNYGDTCEEESGGWTLKVKDSAHAQAAFESDHIRINGIPNTDRSGRYASARTISSIDFSHFRTLKFICQTSQMGVNDGDTAYFKFGYASSTSAFENWTRTNNTQINGTLITATLSNETTYSIDISNVTSGNFYIGGNVHIAKAQIYKVWLDV